MSQALTPSLAFTESDLHGEAIQRRESIHCSADWGAHRQDWVAVEEPLEIRVNGAPLATIMRTPGHDEELVLGFLLAEQVIVSRADISSMRHCTEVSVPEAEDNVMQVVLQPGISFDISEFRRHLTVGSSCGICGKTSIESIVKQVGQLPLDAMEGMRFTLDVLYRLPALLREAQAGFVHTGALHAAGLFDDAGQFVCVREDVGRHNAVDKALGHWLAAQAESGSQQAPVSGLMLSGRVSFELVQKASIARIPVVAAVSAPTSLAIQLATALGITLIGFLRDKTLNVYSHPHRVLVP